MAKLEKLIPEKISIVGHRVVVDEKTFGVIIATINDLIEIVSNLKQESSKHNKAIGDSKEAIKTLAQAFKTLTEE